MRQAARYIGIFYLVLLLVSSLPSVAQVGYNPNGFQTQGTGNDKDDNGNHHGHENPNNPKSTNIPIDDHVWLLFVGGMAIGLWQYRNYEKVKNTPTEQNL